MYVYVLQVENTQNNTVGKPLYSTTKVTVLVSKFIIVFATDIAPWLV